MKKILKYLLRLTLIITGLFAFYLLSAFCLSRITVNRDVKASDDVTIYIKTNGVHADLVVPVKHPQMDWSTQVKFSNTVLNDSTMKWLALGWGDKGFYLQTPTWADLKFSVAFKAAFGLSTTAIHATFYKNLTESKSCKKINISEEQYQVLTKYLLDSFQKDSTGQVKFINTTAKYNNRDAFYEANGKYSLFKTCNTWANTGLKISGQKSCFWTAFDTGIFLKYK
ncbi:TIGR02117 family protein [Flavitalea sp.]|nr:TIGR02117 family protein [Flavitalea sp.]